MDKQQAKEIADLLNARNKLVVQYDADRILAAANNYLYLSSDANGIGACVELKRVQWYQFEISHLTVVSSREGKGDAWKLLRMAEERAIDIGGRVLQCTIRDNNCRSQQLFEKNGFVRTVVFYYPVSGNNVGVWQKSISAPKHEGETQN
jgi:GNAT superfamily N-acetyltransferase